MAVRLSKRRADDAVDYRKLSGRAYLLNHASLSAFICLAQCASERACVYGCELTVMQ
jgi:hypothetical protein